MPLLTKVGASVLWLLAIAAFLYGAYGFAIILGGLATTLLLATREPGVKLVHADAKIAALSRLGLLLMLAAILFAVVAARDFGSTPTGNLLLLVALVLAVVGSLLFLLPLARGIWKKGPH